MASPIRQRPRGKGGFLPAARLVQDRIRAAGESRGFAVSRLLTHWDEIVGPDIAAMARPIRMGFRRDGFGATLVLLTSGPLAPLVQMQTPTIRERVNACYGYNAVSKITLTQTAAEGLAEDAPGFDAAPPEAATHGRAAPGARGVDPAPPADPAVEAEAAAVTEGVEDPALRAALEVLARNVLSRQRTRKDNADG